MPEHELDALQSRHLACRAKLTRDGVLVANGPLAEQSDPSLRGLSILSCDLDEARRLSERALGPGGAADIRGVRVVGGRRVVGLPARRSIGGRPPRTG